jgi:hypothetical protein
MSYFSLQMSELLGGQIAPFTAREISQLKGAFPYPSQAKDGQTCQFTHTADLAVASLKNSDVEHSTPRKGADAFHNRLADLIAV